MAFHESYSNLFIHLPSSLIKAGWNRLTTQKKNPLSESEASSISPIIEAFLKHEDICSTIEVPVSRPKELYLNEAPNSLLCNTNIQVIKTQGVIAPQYSKEEVNARIKEATDNLRQEFIKSTEETLKTIKQQKDIECNQIKIDMNNRAKNLFEITLKKYIQDGTIFNLIHALEEKDGRLYPDISRFKAL
ncbi:hypothetical protein C2G38_2176241 [Gigaspora rosea]|uniref:Uncharacterized protein n=1 Tax=Gigaspora rosea TaxID=44941 RepID=A0A397VHU5_9GLOM|nr:hypothetical protein C2G38_2176241 [Gigaspora rosea]